MEQESTTQQELTNKKRSSRNATGSNAPKLSTRQARLQEIKSFFKTLTLFLLAAVFLRTSVVEAFKIPSGSMEPTLRIGDHILVTKLNYGFRFIPFKAEVLFSYAQPKRGDIVVFTLPESENTPGSQPGINIIKRVVGIGGDTIEVKSGRVWINNQQLDEEYAQYLEGGIGPDLIVKVPEGHVFMMGDNRDKSRDSRYWKNPFLDVRRIKGKAQFVYWSWDNFSRIGESIR